MPHSKLRHYLKGTFAGSISEGLQILLRLMSLWLLTQILPKDVFGSYAFVVALFQILALLSTAGLDQALLYRIAERDRQDGQMEGKDYGAFVLLAVFILSIVTALVVAGGGQLMPETVVPHQFAFWLIAVGSALPFQTMERVFIVWYTANHRIPEARLLALIQPSLYVLLLGTCYLVWPSSTAVAASFVSAIALAIIVWILWTGFSNFARPQWPEGADIGYSLKLMFAKMAHTGVERIDIVMLGLLAGSTATAEYAIASRFAVLGSLGNKLIAPIFTPRLRQALVRHETNALKREYDQNRLFETGFAVAGLILFVLLGQSLLKWFGNYEGAWPVLLVLAAVQVVQTGFGPNGRYLNMAGYGTATMATSWALLVVAVALNWLLIPPLGAIGAATATLISIGLINSMISFLIWKWDRFTTVTFTHGLLAAIAGSILGLLLAKAISATLAFFALLAIGTYLLLDQKHLWLPVMSAVYKEIRSLRNSTND